MELEKDKKSKETEEKAEDVVLSGMEENDAAKDKEVFPKKDGTPSGSEIKLMSRL